MNINIYLENHLSDVLKSLAEQEGKSRNAIIREAISEWIEQRHPSVWPESVMKYCTSYDFPRFENYREELMAPKEDPFE